MNWELKSDRPIYMQLVEQMELRIISGQFKAGERLPAVRELAAQAEVNPNTMQRALAELERKELVYTQRTSGRFITEDEQMIRKLQDMLAQMEVEKFLEKMGQLGYSHNEAVELLKNLNKERLQ